MENALLDILRQPKDLDARLAAFCREHFAYYLHCKPLFGGVLVEVGGRINMDLMLDEAHWLPLLAALEALPPARWAVQRHALREQMLLKLTFREGARRKEFQSPPELAALGLADFRRDLLITQLRKSRGMLIVTGPSGPEKIELLHSLVSTAQQADFRRGGGWIGALHSPPLEHFVWFNCSGVAELELRELKTVLNGNFDVITWEAGVEREIWLRLLQAVRDDKLVIVSTFERTAMDVLLMLRHLNLPPDLLGEVLAVLAAFPLETASGKPNARQVYEYLEMRPNLLHTLQHDGTPDMLIDVAGEQENFWSLYADAMKGVAQGDFKPATVKARLSWVL